MAEGALEQSEAQVTVATSGIAGEDCVNENHDKGILWIACAGIDKKTREYDIKGGRKDFCLKSVLAALELLYEFISV